MTAREMGIAHHRDEGECVMLPMTIATLNTVINRYPMSLRMSLTMVPPIPGMSGCVPKRFSRYQVLRAGS